MKRFFSDINDSDNEEECTFQSKRVKMSEVNKVTARHIDSLNECYVSLMKNVNNKRAYGKLENQYKNEEYDLLAHLEKRGENMKSFVHLLNHTFKVLPRMLFESENQDDDDVSIEITSDDEETDYEDGSEYDEEEEEEDKETAKEITKQIFSKIFDFNLDEQMEQKSFTDTIESSSLPSSEKTRLSDKYNQIVSFRKTQVPDRFKVIDMDVPIEVRSELLEKMDVLDKSQTEDIKTRDWINNVMKIPFGKYTQNPVKDSTNVAEVSKFLKNFKKTLNEAIYGQTQVKETLVEIIANWATNKSNKGYCIAINGPAGTGKTSLIREGLAKALNRPFCSFSLAGISDENYLSGFPFTYEGASCGRFAKMLIDTKCMDPIIFMDELDKVETKRSMSVFNKLIEITDFSQNHEIEDHYFGSNIKLDMSRCIFIFSLNELEMIDPILRDRLEVITVNGFDTTEKIKIATEFLIPREMNEYSFEVDFTEKMLRYIISKSKKGGGVRDLKRHINQIFRKLNVLRFTDDVTYNIDIDNKNKVKMNKKMVDKLLKEVNKVPEIILHMYN